MRVYGGYEGLEGEQADKTGFLMGIKIKFPLCRAQGESYNYVEKSYN